MGVPRYYCGANEYHEPHTYNGDVRCIGWHRTNKDGVPIDEDGTPLWVNKLVDAIDRLTETVVPRQAKP